MIKKMKKKPLPLTLMIVSAVAMLLINYLSLRFSTIVLMMISGCISLTLFCIHDKGGKKA
jgi:chromate transporter